MKHLILLLVLLATLISCEDEFLQDEVVTELNVEALKVKKALSPLINYDIRTYFPDYQAPINTQKGKLVTKPIKIRAAGTISLIFPDSEIEVILEGKGHASHLGRFTFYARYTTDENSDLNDFFVYGKILGVLTAANGDELYSEFIKTGIDPIFGAYHEWVFYNGTGRFENATGAVRLYSSFDFSDKTWTYDGEGTITYKSSFRKNGKKKKSVPK